MKKHLLLLLSLLLTTTMLFAERVSQSDAATVASNFLNGAVTSTKKSKAVTPNRMTLKTAAAASESQYYVYENPDGGWVMVSASDVLQPILAYSKTGTFSFENQPDNVKKWLGKYEDLIKKVEADGVEASAEASAQWNALKKSLPDDPAGTVIVGPLVQTKWDQDIPYDFYTPGTGSYGSGTKAAVGCVATAMAQVMNYWQWPVNGTGSHKYQPEMDIWEENESTGEYEYKETIVIFEGELEADFENTTYQWAKMKNSYSSNYNADPDRAVATLMYHCGIAVDMQYGGSDYDGSGALTINYNDDDELCAQNALWKYFRYKKDGLVSYKRDGYIFLGTTYYNYWTDAAWTAMVKEELDKQHPIMYDGSGTGGHSFICDGYDNKDYFHFNWGWSGSNDGWYKLNNLVPGSGGAGGGSYSFSEDQSVIIGIVPDKPDEDLYILGEVEGNGYNWDPSKGAKMNFANNVFTLTTRIKGTGDYGYLSFTTALASGSSAWDEIASSRLGADASDKLVSSGSMYSLTTDYNNAFMFPNGVWTITVDLENKKMTAVKPTTYTVTWNIGGTATTAEFVKDAALELPAAPSACDNGKVFVGWTEATSVSSDAAPADIFTKAGTKTVTKNITYNAVFATATSGGSGAGWELVTDASTLKEGDVLVIASNSNGKTAGDISNSIMAEVESTFKGTDLQSLGDGTVELTLGGSEGAWTLTSSNGSLGATAVKKVAWDNGTTTWSISISDNNATIQNGTENYGRFLYNVGSPRFTTYTSNTSSIMLLPQLYRKASSYSDFSLGCGTVTPVATEWTITLVDVPQGWGSTINLYAWDNNLNPLNGEWPGTAMTANRGTTYTATLTVYGSNPVANIIFNDGTNQTVDIEGITGPGHFRVNSTKEDAKYTANEVYKVSLAELSHGEISGLSTWYAAGDEVSFTATPDENYSLSSLTVKEDESGNEVSVSGGKFTMPAADVTLAAVFAKESAKVTVTWSVDGKTTPVQFNEGDALVLPTAPDACDNGKVFVGWTTSSVVDGSAPAVLFKEAGDMTVDADITYYAVFAKATTSSGGSAESTVTFTKDDFSGQGTANTGSDVSATKNGVTFSCTKGYCADESLRCYAHGMLSIVSSSASIVKISFTTTGGKTGGLDAEVTVNAQEYEVADLASQARFTEIVVTLGGGGSSTTYSEFALSCDGSTSKSYTFTLVDVPDTWETPLYLFAWLDVSIVGDWPGKEMAKNAKALDAPYSATVTVENSDDVPSIIFSSANGLQTVDITDAVPGARYRVNAATDASGKYSANVVYKVTAAAENGSVSGLGDWYAEGENVSFSVTPAEGYELDQLTVKDADNQSVEVNNNEFVMPAKDVTITASFKAKEVTYTVNWSVAGVVKESKTYASGAALAMPEITVPDCEGEGAKVFVGWTAETTVDGNAPAVLFKEAGDMTVDADITYYAVFATATASGSGSGSNYELYSGSITEGDYLIVYDGVAMNTTTTSNRLQYSVVTIENDAISNPDASIIWHIAASGDYWTLYNEEAGAYAASTGTKNQATTATESSDKTLWTVSGDGTYEFVNKNNSANSTNANLRRNGTYGFACYATSTGGALSLYKSASGGTILSNFSLECEGGSVDPEEVNLTPTNAQAWYYADNSTSGSHNWVMNFADGDFDVASWSFNMQIEVNTAEANALAGSYDENDGVVIGLPDETHTVLMDGLKTIEGKEVSLKLTYNSKDAAGNPTYDVVISFLGDDGKLYKINKEALAIIAKDVDSEELIDLYGDTGTPLTKHEIVYYTCGEQWTKQSYYDGDILWFPSNPPAQNGKAFVGWTTTEHYTGAVAPTFIVDGIEVHESANYHAVYK